MTGFDYNHNPTTFGNPFSGTVSLIDATTSTTPYSQAYAVGSPAVVPFTGLNIALAAGNVYQLVASSTIVSNGNDEVYQYGVLNSPPFAYPVSDTNISVTQGAFNNNPGFQESAARGAFTNITTTSAAVPEPSTLRLSLIGIVGVLIYTRRARRTATT